MKLLGKIVTVGFFMVAAHSLPPPMDVYVYLGRVVGALLLAGLVIWLVSKYHK